MLDHIDFEQVVKNLAGVIGALVSMRFLKGPLLGKLVMACGGAAFSFFAAEWVSAKTSLPEGLAGFLLGLFGMSVLSRIWEWFEVTTFDFSNLFKGWFKVKDLKDEE